MSYVRFNYSNGSTPSVDSEFCTVNETGTIRRQEDNGLSDLVCCSRTTRRRLGRQLIEPLTHRLRAFRARRSRAHCVDADTARSVFSRPSFGQQINGGLARAV